MIKLYKVIALSVGGLNKKIYHSGDVVSELAWVNGRAEELVKLGFLKLHGETPIKVSKEPLKEKIVPPIVLESTIDNEPKLPEQGKGELEVLNEKVKANFEDISIREMWDDLLDKNIDFDPNSSKEEIYDIWIKS